MIGYFKAALATWIDPGSGVRSRALVEAFAPGLCFCCRSLPLAAGRLVLTGLAAQISFLPSR